MLKDAHRRKFDVVVVWACDRLARSTKHFLQVLDELNELGVQFLSQREAIDTDGLLAERSSSSCRRLPNLNAR
jgi:DNA invertase Pin-like site-specific DNA recombinase